MTLRPPHPANQLDRVICQIRFPALLEIDEMVAEFQKGVRANYPIYSKSSTFPLNLANVPIPTDHTFQSDDKVWSITLSVAALSITTTRYTDWGQFRSKLDQAISAALDLFDIKTCNRVGLRYINAIRPSSVELPDPKSSLRAPYSEMMCADLGTTTGVHTIIEYTVDDHIAGRSVIGMIRFNDGEEGALIDNDTFVEEQMPIEEALDVLDRLNSCSLETFKKISSDNLISKVIP